MMVESDSNQTTQGWMIGFWVALLGTAMIVGAVVVRLTTAAITLSWFDVDPTSVDHAALGLLPSDRFGLDAIMLFGAALVFAGQFIRGRGAAWWILLLAALPIPVLLWHGWDDPADLEQGSLWIASVVAAVALAHGAGNSWLRATGLAILLAGLAPLVIKAIAQVAWDIPATIAYFDANRADVLAMRGLEPGSSAARVLERRLRNAVPTTWFSSTNLLASVLAAGVSVWFAITLVAIREKVASGVSGLCAFIALAMAAIVIATGSLGGWVVLFIGLCFAAAGVFFRGWYRIGGWVAVGLVVLALLAAPLGSLLGDLPGIRSLVIRSGYVAGASQITAEAPWVGVGPAGFQSAWLQVRGAGSAEEIVSPHSMPWDWIATTGVLALAWVGLVLVGLWWAPRCDQRSPREPDDPFSLGRIVFVISCLVVGFGFTNAHIREMLTLGTPVMVVRLLGWLAFIALAVLLASLWHRVGSGIRIGACAAAVVLVVHAQVEMTIEQPTTVPWILAVLAIAAPVGLAGSTRRRLARPLAALAAVVSVGLAVLVLVIGTVPAKQAELKVRGHGSKVHARGEMTSGLVGLSGRQSAAEGLLIAAAIRNDDRIRLAAAEQLLTGIAMSAAAENPAPPEQVEEARQLVVSIGLDIFERTGSIEAGHLVITALLATGDPDEIERTIPVAYAVSELDPVGLWSQRLFADVLWESGQPDVAAEIYRRVLELNDAREIDRLRQLSDEDRMLIEMRANL